MKGKTGADQLRDWMERRGFNQTETATHFGWDMAFISQLVNGKRLPGLVNAVKIERETGIPVEAWVSSSVDESDREPVAVAGNARRNKA